MLGTMKDMRIMTEYPTFLGSYIVLASILARSDRYVQLSLPPAP